VQDHPFSLASDTVGYQHYFLSAAVSLYPKVDAVQEEVNNILKG
jgi:hypothetical protein